MYTKKLMTSVFLMASSLLISTASYAAPSCSSFLEASKLTTAVSKNPLEALQTEIEQAQTFKEARELTYEKAALGNQLFDQAIDGIIALNNSQTSNPAVAQQQSLHIQSILGALQIAFKVPNYFMGFAISNRLQIEQADLNAKVEALETKRAIGFNRNESAQDFHAEPNANNPIGFQLGTRTAESNQAGAAFFTALMQNLAGRATSQGKATTTGPVGFLSFNSEADSSKPLPQAGFIESKEAEPTFAQSDLPQIIMHVQSGEFRIPEDPNRRSIGF